MSYAVFRPIAHKQKYLMDQVLMILSIIFFADFFSFGLEK